MDLKEKIKSSNIYLDGGMGTLLQEKGLKPGELPELWNLTHPDEIISIHKSYFDAGSNIVNTNTFGANLLKFSQTELENIIKSAIENAKKAASLSETKQDKFIALDIGPSGRLLKPYGDFDFEDAVSLFSETVKIGVKYGADLIFIETMNDSYETKAAVLAAKENSDLPVFVSNAYGEDAKLMTGASPEAMCAMLEGLGVDAIGANCSLGPEQLTEVIDRLLSVSSLPVILKPNAGLPSSDGKKSYYDIMPEEFSESIKKAMEKGVTIVGGCCGTTPDYIKSVFEKTSSLPFKYPTEKNITMVSSYTHAVTIGNAPILIGERINPTGKKRFKEALKNNDIAYILNEGINQQQKGVHILDVNVGLPDIDEEKMLTHVTEELQAIINLPLQIDTSSPKAMESALRRYNGKAMVNSVNGKAESMSQIFPLVKKYGGTVVALTLDESGIPNNADERVKIAEKIVRTAESYGIKKKDIVFDTLSMAVSADASAPAVTLKALEKITDMGINTTLGVSNISFGLPKRDTLNSAFFAFALEKGLSSAIINPYSKEILKVYHSYLALHGYDENCSEYINFMSDEEEHETKISEEQTLFSAISNGMKDLSTELCKKELESRSAMDIINGIIIPALDNVGKGFEENKIYLPRLLMSAEAAKSAFEEVKKNLSSENESKKCTFVLATVKGDIHDIGKNIVKVLLENYGFNVIDLGRDVDPMVIVNTVIEKNAPVCGLSALMTTTVPAMEETIKLLKEKAPFCKTVVGGAVLNPEYADMIGADKYAKDALETVRYAEMINSQE